MQILARPESHRLVAAPGAAPDPAPIVGPRDLVRHAQIRGIRETFAHHANDWGVCR